jgi:hypothetical protein
MGNLLEQFEDVLNAGRSLNELVELMASNISKAREYLADALKMLEDDEPHSEIIKAVASVYDILGGDGEEEVRQNEEQKERIAEDQQELPF